VRRTVLVTHFYPAHGGGVEKVAEQLAAHLARDEGIAITWCASDTDAPPDLPGVRCEPMAAVNTIERVTGFPYPLWTPGALRRLARLVREADAVHVHDGIYAGSLAAAALARRHRRRLVVTQHIAEVPLKPPARWLLAAANRVAAHQVLERADAVAFISPAVQHHFEALSGARPQYHYVANGVDTAVFHPPKDGLSVAQRRAGLGFDPMRPLLLFVGRFVPKKRLPIVRAIAAARPDWQWCIVGQGVERPQGWRLSNVVVRPPMPQAELAGLYRAADLLVLPSEGEGFPLVVQEAMACGLPACITDAVAAGSTVPAELLVRLPDAVAHSTQDAAQAIAQWLDLPEAARAARRAACAAFAASEWSWDHAARRHAGWLRGDAR
jgi:glycosyltransferase involved in cell wall biosynthesis